MTRMSLQNAKIEAGLVRLPKSAPWLVTFLTEVAEFPNGKYDDQVDTMSQILAILDRGPHQIRGIGRYK